MDTKTLVELRRKAEKAVEDMADGSLKVKAFEVILASLLGGGSPAPAPTPAAATDIEVPRAKDKSAKADVPARTLTGRILVLKDEGFFRTQQSIGKIREELKAHGWHYPVTTLSGALQNLVRSRQLRRERAAEGKKKLWKYSNP